MSQNAKFWDKMAAGYAKSKIGDMASYEHKLDLTRKYFSPQTRLLELGCGTGSTAILHAPYVAHIHATDLSSEMLKIAAGKLGDINNITFERCSVEDLSAAPASYDAVMAMSLLHLLDDHEAAVARVFSLLKPGGVFISSTICLSEAFWFLRPVIPLGRLLGLMPMVRFFTRDALEQSLMDAGFVIEEQFQPARNKAVFLVARKPAD